jgi:ankyrin repeat protein
MSQKPPTRAMRENPDLDQLKRQAKELLEDYRARQPDALAEVNFYHRTPTPETFGLHDAQYVLARTYGFESWPKLKAAVQGATNTNLHQAAERGDFAAVRELLTRRPELARGDRRALQIAVLRRDLAMTELLLEFEADPGGGEWTSPYGIARDRGYDEIVDAIRAARTKRGEHGLQGSIEALGKFERVAKSGNEEALCAVLDEHPELAEITLANGMSMLHQAVCHGALRITNWLLDHGADVNRKAALALFHGATFLPNSPQGWTPIDFAATGHGGDWLFDTRKFERIAKVLLDHGAHLTPLSAATLGRWDYLKTFSKRELEGKGLLEASVKGNQPELLRRLLDLGLDPDELIQVGHMSEPTWSSGGPLFQAVVLGRFEPARLLVERGANPNARVFTAGSPADRAYGGDNAEMIALIEQYGGWIDAGLAGGLGKTEVARRMLVGEIDPHLETTAFSAQPVAEQLLYYAASSQSVDIVRMALDHIDWPPDDARWFWMLFRPVDYYDGQRKMECLECFKLILARCSPHLRAAENGQSMLHQAIEGDHGIGFELAAILLDAGAHLDIRDKILLSTPLGWACRWGRLEMVKLFIERGADIIEADAEPWATPRAWAEKKGRREILDLIDKSITPG